MAADTTVEFLERNEGIALVRFVLFSLDVLRPFQDALRVHERG